MTRVRPSFKSSFIEVCVTQLQLHYLFLCIDCAALRTYNAQYMINT